MQAAPDSRAWVAAVDRLFDRWPELSPTQQQDELERLAISADIQNRAPCVEALDSLAYRAGWARDQHERGQGAFDRLVAIVRRLAPEFEREAIYNAVTSAVRDDNEILISDFLLSDTVDPRELRFALIPRRRHLDVMADVHPGNSENLAFYAAHRRAFSVLRVLFDPPENMIIYFDPNGRRETGPGAGMHLLRAIAGDLREHETRVEELRLIPARALRACIAAGGNVLDAWDFRSEEDLDAAISEFPCIYEPLFRAVHDSGLSIDGSEVPSFFQRALRFGCAGLARFLLNLGANAYAGNENPFDWLEGSRPDCADVLISAGLRMFEPLVEGSMELLVTRVSSDIVCRILQSPAARGVRTEDLRVALEEAIDEEEPALALVVLCLHASSNLPPLDLPSDWGSARGIKRMAHRVTRNLSFGATKDVALMKLVMPQIITYLACMKRTPPHMPLEMHMMVLEHLTFAALIQVPVGATIWVDDAGTPHICPPGESDGVSDSAPSSDIDD